MSVVRCPSCGTPAFTISGWADLDRCPRCRSALATSATEPDSGPLVVGYDGRASGDDALALARLLDRDGERTIIVVSAIDRALPDNPLGDPDHDREELDEQVRAALLGNPRLETIWLRSGSPARELASVALASGAAMIVIGSSHRGRVGRVMPGTVEPGSYEALPVRSRWRRGGSPIGAPQGSLESASHSTARPRPRRH